MAIRVPVTIDEHVDRAAYNVSREACDAGFLSLKAVITVLDLNIY